MGYTVRKTNIMFALICSLSAVGIPMATALYDNRLEAELTESVSEAGNRLILETRETNSRFLQEKRSKLRILSGASGLKQAFSKGGRSEELLTESILDNRDLMPELLAYKILNLDGDSIEGTLPWGDKYYSQFMPSIKKYIEAYEKEPNFQPSIMPVIMVNAEPVLGIVMPIYTTGKGELLGHFVAFFDFQPPVYKNNIEYGQTITLDVSGKLIANAGSAITESCQHPGCNWFDSFQNAPYSLFDFPVYIATDSADEYIFMVTNSTNSWDNPVLSNVIIIDATMLLKQKNNKTIVFFCALLTLPLLLIFAIWAAPKIRQHRRYMDEKKIIVDTMPNGFILLDSEFKVKDINNDGQKYLSLMKADVLPGRYLPSDSKLRGYIDEFLSAGTQRFIYKVNNTDTPNTYLKFLLTYSLRDDEINYFTFNIQDVSDEKEREENLREETETLNEMVRVRTAELEEALKEAKDINQMKSNFVSSVSHEMRTPLNGIKGAVELIGTENLSSNQLRFMSLIRSSSYSLMRLINDILDYSKMESDRLELVDRDFDIVRVADRVLEASSIEKKNGVSLVLDAEEVVFSSVRGDPLRFEQVLTNLVSNAVKFTRYGSITVSLRAQSGPEYTTVLARVTDTGTGIQEDKLESIFDRFSQGSKEVQVNHGGTGLGLAISKGLCQLLGGDLKVTSTYGKGSTFVASFQFERPVISTTQSVQPTKVYIPHYRNQDIESYIIMRLRRNDFEFIQEDYDTADGTLIFHQDSNQVINVAPLPKPVVVISQGKPSIVGGEAQFISSDYIAIPQIKYNLMGLDSNIQNEEESVLLNSRDYQQAKVLVVDDNETNRIVVKGLLERLGCEVATADDGKQAVEKVFKSEPDVVLMDCHMPEMDGFTATKAIRSSGGFDDLPIVALTAAAMAGERERCLNAGMNEYLTKPLVLEDAIVVLDRLLGHDSLHQSAALERLEKPDESPVLLTWDKEGMYRRLHDLTELISSVKESYKNRWQSRLAKIEAAYVDGSAEELRKEAHGFKGLAKEVSAIRLAEHLRKMEVEATKGHVDDADLILLKDEITKFNSEFF